MPRYFIEVAYKGTNYSGFQMQDNGITIQSEVENALAIKFGQSFQLTGASRTDAGVHALQNYFHFDAVTDLFYPADTKEKKINQVLYSLNSILPKDIVVKKIVEVDEKQHCRFNALSREYKYYICNKKNPFYKDTAYFYPYTLDIEKLQRAAKTILHTKDFESFAKKNTQVNNFICSVYKSEWIQKNDFLIYNVVANRFLRGMVKGLVGTMLKTASGRISLDEFMAIIKSQDSSNADFSVPSHGLFLVEVRYK
jgi:tRNA pseudouridine38-40 synthase